MNLFEHILRSITWTLVHSIWIGLPVALAAGLVILFTKNRSAAVRYSLLCLLFFALSGATLLTFVLELNFEGKGAGSAIYSSGIILFEYAVSLQPATIAANFINQHSVWIVGVWSIVMMLRLARLLLDAVYVNRLRSRLIYQSENNWQLTIQELSATLGIKKKVRLFESAMTKIPVMIGHARPLILVPVGLLTQLSPAQAEAVLLHELAHIRRHDYMVNYLQRIAGLFLFFNPAYLWLSARLRRERENCCDDMAIAVTNDKVGYVEALVNFRERTLSPGQYALGLFGKRKPLLQRVKRLVYGKNEGLSLGDAIFFIAGIGFLVLTFSGSAGSFLASGNESNQIAEFVAPAQSPATEVAAKAEQKQRTVRRTMRRIRPTVIPDDRTASAPASIPTADEQKPADMPAQSSPMEGREPQRNEERDHILEQRRLAEVHRQRAAESRKANEERLHQAQRDRIAAGIEKSKAASYRQHAVLQAQRSRLAGEDMELRRLREINLQPRR